MTLTCMITDAYLGEKNTSQKFLQALVPSSETIYSYAKALLGGTEVI